MVLPASIQDTVAVAARKAGFSRAGVAPVPAPESETDYPELRHFEPWIEHGCAGEMEYLKRRDQANRLLRSSPRIAFPWVRSVIVCAANYNADAPRSIDPEEENSAWIARYAWTGYAGAESDVESEDRPSDYHRVLLERLKQLDRELQEVLGPFQSRCYVDTGPVVERIYAKYAGIGWIGKNTCILNQELGSWLFLGVILAEYDLPPASGLEMAADRCGSCTLCIDACPTHALTAPYRMDASLCISYLTIEKRGAIPEELRSAVGRQVFGCDICQDVCPWNRRAPVSDDRALAVRRHLVNPALDWLGELDSDAFDRLFRHSPVQRTKLSGLLRNVAIAMGNSGLTRHLPKLQVWSGGQDPVLAEAARWAIARIEEGLAATDRTLRSGGGTQPEEAGEQPRISLKAVP